MEEIDEKTDDDAKVKAKLIRGRLNPFFRIHSGVVFFLCEHFLISCDSNSTLKIWTIENI